MRIAVNTRLLLPGKLDGIGWFTYETLKRITTAHKEHEFIFIFDRKPSDEFIFSDNITPVVAYPQARHPLLWFAFFEMGVPYLLNKHKADAFFSPDGWLSLSSNKPMLPVMHDLNWEHFPAFIPWHVRQYYFLFFKRYAQKAKRIATVSDFTRKDLVKQYSVDEAKIDVIYNGANTMLKPMLQDSVTQVQSKYAQGCPYFLFIGTIHPRKNLGNTMLAFDAFKKQTGSNMKLMVVGSKKWWTSIEESAYQQVQHKEDIIFFGRASAEQLAELIPACFALTYFSFFEGFGIPLLEAMYCDIPLLVSNASSLPEVGQDAALYAAPDSVEAMSAIMIQLFKDNTLRATLINNGKRIREEFSWDKTSGLLWESIEKAFIK